MAKLIKFLFFLLVCSSATNAQERSVYGRIIDSTRHEGINGLIIQNKTSGQMVNSNNTGDFYIRAVAGDSLIVMDIGYERAGTIYDGQNRYPVIETKTQPIMLREVVITEKRWGELQNEINDFLNNPQNAGAIRKEILGNLVNSSTENSTPAVVGISIDGLYELWSKQGKLNRKVADLKYNDIKEFYVGLKYNRKTILQITKLDEHEIEDFMAYCKPNEDFILRATDYELTNKILACLKEYRTSRVFRRTK
jgi:hypothetical protein